jgi:GNAT superfamily N-acetyltransferase
MPPTIVCAKSTEAPLVSSVLTEAADWVESRGEPLWRHEHVSIDAVAANVAAGLYYIAWLNDEAAGVVRFQLEDAIFWPEAIEGEAVYLHRLAVRRRYAGGISGALLNWAVSRASELGRRYVRLDCASDRSSLRNVYERFGFRLHSERNMGRFIVARYQIEAVSAA